MAVSTLRYMVFDICSHNYSIMYQNSNVRAGNIRKSGPGRTKLIGGWLSEALNGAEAWTGGRAGVEAWTGGRAGVEKKKDPARGH